MKVYSESKKSWVEWVIESEEQEDGEDYQYPYIAGVYTHPEERRQGVATRLIKETIGVIASEWNLVYIVAEPFEGNISVEDLVAFYEKIGFSVDEDKTDKSVILCMTGI